MIPHNKPTFSRDEELASQSVIQSGWVAQGKQVSQFENEMCQYLGLPNGHAVAVSSGTAALFLALHVLGAKSKKVGLPVYACSALRHAIGMAGGEEALFDVQESGPNIDPAFVNQSEAKIVIAPHMYGIPIDCSLIKDQVVIEDCAQALGASVGGQKVGLSGAVGIFSFYATKLITSGGQGGMVVSNDLELISAIKDYREFDCRRDQKNRFNFQMTDIQATIGRVQLSKLPEFLERRKAIFQAYWNAGLDLMEGGADSNSIESVYYRAVLKCEDPFRLKRILEENGVKAIIPIEDWELLGPSGRFPHAFNLTQSTLSLPIYPTLSNEELDKILNTITKFV